MTRRSARWLVMVLGAFLAGPARAAAQAPSCTISVTSVAFGSYNVFAATPDDSTGTIGYNCNASASNISIALSPGSSGNFSPRTMQKGGETLGYNLYRNAGRTSIWGDGTGGTSIYTRANPPNNTNVTLTIYGRIPAGQDVGAGGYSDTVSAVINF